MPSERLVEARNSWKRKRKARLDGARKPDPVENPEYGGDSPLFEDARGDAKKIGSLISTNSKKKLKKIFGMDQEEIPQEPGKTGLGCTQSTVPVSSQNPALNQHERNHSANTRNDNLLLGKERRGSTLSGARERFMATRASREEDKDDFGENSDLDESDNRPQGSERRRMSGQIRGLSFSEFRDRNDVRHQRKNSEKEAQLFRIQTMPKGPQGEHHKSIRMPRRGVSPAKDEPQAYQSPKANDRTDGKEKGITRILNAVRTPKTHPNDREVEGHAGMGRTSGTSQPGE